MTCEITKTRTWNYANNDMQCYEVWIESKSEQPEKNLFGNERKISFMLSGNAVLDDSGEKQEILEYIKKYGESYFSYCPQEDNWYIKIRNHFISMGRKFKESELENDKI